MLSSCRRSSGTSASRPCPGAVIASSSVKYAITPGRRIASRSFLRHQSLTVFQIRVTEKIMFINFKCHQRCTSQGHKQGGSRDVRRGAFNPATPTTDALDSKYLPIIIVPARIPTSSIQPSIATGRGLVAISAGLASVRFVIIVVGIGVVDVERVRRGGLV